MIKLTYTSTLASCVTFFLGSFVYAADSSSIDIGDFELKTVVDSVVEYDDNVFRSAAFEESSTVFRVKPNVSLTNNNTQRDIELFYNAEAVYFSDFKDDNYLAQDIGVDTLFNIGKANRLGFYGTYTDGREARGTGSSEGTIANNTTGATEFTQFDAGLNYLYGSENRPLSVEASFGVTDLEFDNFRLITAQRDYDAVSFSTLFDYKYSAATSVFLDINYIDYDYSSVSNATGFELDSTQVTTHIGLAWSATRNTTGRIGFGSTSKDLDKSSNESFGTWNVALDWEPSSSDMVSFETQKNVSEPAGTGVYILSKQTGVSWVREISPRLSFNAYISNTESEFEGELRQDDIDLYGLDVVYEFTRTLDLTASYQNEEKDSNIASFDFKRNVFLFTLSVGL